MGRIKLKGEQIRLAVHADFIGIDCMLAVHDSHIDAIVNGHVAPRAGWGDDEDDCPSYSRVGSIAVVSIRGCLGQRGGLWWDGHESIRAKLEKALLDPSVGAIALDISSPGGVVAGCWDNVRAVQAAKVRSGKPILGYAHEHAYSAAYAWSMVCDELYLPESGGVGSIGVLSILYDQSKMWDEAGIKFAIVRSGERKARGNGYEPLDQTTVDESQARVDLLAGQFFALVSAQRKIKVDALRALEGACFDGIVAVEKKLADGILSWDAFLDKAEQAGRKQRMKNTAKVLGLHEDASESQVVSSIEALQKDVALLASVKAQNADNAVELAMATGRITAGQKETEYKAVIDSPINASQGLRLRPVMGALHSPTLGEKKADNAGAPPDTVDAMAKLAACDDATLAAWYGAVDASTRTQVGNANPRLLIRASGAWRITQGITN
jgi:ClpP class serine protease